MEFDLTQRLLPHLDRHLCLPLLDFLEQTGQYTHQDLLQAKLEILQSTNMVNYIAQLDKELDNGNGNSQVQQGKERKPREVMVSTFGRQTARTGKQGSCRA
jgi:translation initiation factor 3 subunit E